MTPEEAEAAAIKSEPAEDFDVASHFAKTMRIIRIRNGSVSLSEATQEEVDSVFRVCMVRMPDD